MTLPLLGLDAATLSTLRRECHVVFHVAATVDFNAPIRTACELNVEGPLNCLAVSRGMERLEAHVHVSTCYVNSNLRSGTHVEVRPFSPFYCLNPRPPFPATHGADH